MVCYKCHNSISIQKETKNDYSSNQGSGGGGINPYMLPSKSMRFSDMFFPDPMFYPGYYPMMGGQNPYNPYYNQAARIDPYYDPYNQDLDYLYKKKVRYDIMKNKLKADNYKSKVRSEDPLSGRYKAIKGLLDHHDMLVNRRTGGNIDTQSADQFINNNFDNSIRTTNNNNKYSPIYPNNVGNVRSPNKDKGDMIYKNMFTPNKLK
jgi:hypothetical protein